MRNQWEPTPEILETIRSSAEAGALEENIAKLIGIGIATWYKKKKEYPEIQEIIDTAKRSKIALVRGKLWKIIEDESSKNHFQALIYYLNRYDTEDLGKNMYQGSKPSGFTYSAVKYDED